jgi:hypothetical protein
MHLYLALLLYLDASTIGATNVLGVVMALQFFRLPSSVPFMQVLMCAAAVLGLFGAMFRVGYLRLAVFVPQHLILGAMAWGGVVAAAKHQYLDGVPMGWGHINADQVGYMALFVIHSSAIGRRCWDPNG